MPLPPLPHIFDTGLRTSASRNSSLDALIRSQLDLAARNLDNMNTPPPSNTDQVDLVADMGDYFTHTAMLWAQLTEHLVQGPHIMQASVQAHERSREESHFSDLREVAKMDVNIGKLRKIRNLSLKFSQEVQATWRPVPPTLGMQPIMRTSISPFFEGKIPTASETTSFSSGYHALNFSFRKLLPDKSQIIHQTNKGGDMSGSDCSSDDDDDEQFQSIDMEALRQRGKGVYFCPKGHKCDKGGVDKDGNLVVFDRNSSFAQHCNKHRKPWRCDIPGCPNPPKKRRFARRDGLERHKTTVKHYIVT